jgi:zinc protease
MTRASVAINASLLLLVAAMHVNAQPSEPVFPFKLHEKTLDNGLSVLVIPTDYPDIVAIQIPVRVGSRNEVEPGRSGFAHFFEHMMFRGTKRFSPEAYNEILKKAGADTNAYTTDDFTNYHTTFAKEDLETVLMVEADRFMNLDYPLPAFQTEARAVLGEYNKNYSDPINKALEALRDNAFQKHTYKHTTMGFIQDIEKMPEMYDYSRQFFDRFYRPERTTIIVAGDVRPSEVFAIVERHWGAWERGDFEDAIPVEPPPTQPVYVHVPWKTQTPTWVAVSFHGPAASDRDLDMSAMSIVAGLGFGQSSDLYRKLVIDDQIVDRLFPFFPERSDPALITVMARVKDASDTWKVRDAIQSTFQSMRDQPLPTDRLQAIQSRMRYSFANRLDNSEIIAAALVPYVATLGDWSAINRVYAQYATLTPEAIQGLARKWFRDARMVVLTLGHGALPEQEDPIGSVEQPVQGGSAGKWMPGPVPHYLHATQSPLVDVRIVFPFGASHGPPGLANLAAAMIAQGGSASMTYAEIQRALFPMAASFTAHVDKEMTTFTGRVHRDHLAEYWRIVGDQLLDPGWREEDFTRVKANIINQIRTDLRANNDEELAKEVLYEFIYRRPELAHMNYGWLNLGRVEDLEDFTLDSVKTFYASFLCGHEPWVGLAGGFDSQSAGRIVDDVRTRRVAPEGAEGSRILFGSATKDRRTSPYVRIIQKDTRATALSFGFPIDVTRKHEDFAALWLARSWLGEHRSSNSHLFQRMREIRGMNYGNYAYIEYFPRGMFQFHPDPGLCRKHQIFQVWIRPVPPEQAVFALRIARFELDRLVREGLTEKQFAETRDYLTKFVALLVKSQDRQLGYAMDSRWYGMNDFVTDMRAALGRLTVEDVNRAIREHLTSDELFIVFVAPDAEALASKLASGEPSPIRYESPKSQETLEEDEVIERYPLGIRRESIEIVPVSEVFEGL